MKLYLCRHGETEYNNKGLSQGPDVELNETGRSQAEMLADRFEDRQIDDFYCSPLPRATETAEIVALKHAESPEKLEGLREKSSGEFAGKPWKEKHEAATKSDGPFHEFRPEGGENFFDVKERALSELNRLKERHHGEKVVAVAHGHTNRVLLVSALGYGLENAIKISQDNTCVNVVEWRDQWGWIVNGVNDTNHLE